MSMKTWSNKMLYSIVAIFFVSNIFSQITYQEISRNKIKSILETNKIFLNGGSAPIIEEKVTFYDDKGFDTLIKKDGKKYQTFNRKYNDKNQLIYAEKISHVIPDDIDSCTYVYNTDGSFTEIQFSKKYQFSFIYKYDKKGRMIYLKIPDGTIKTYEYDKFNNKNPSKQNISTYNIKGKLIRTYPKKNKDLFTEYTYNLKGFVARIVINYPEDYELDYKRSITNYFYQY